MSKKKIFLSIVIVLMLSSAFAYAKDGYWTAGNSRAGVSLRISGARYTGICSNDNDNAKVKVKIVIKIYDYYDGVHVTPQTA